MRSIDLASELDAKVVSIWAGVAPGCVVGDTEDGHDAIWDRLADGVALLLGEARQRGVQLAFEPEPGMFIEGPLGYGALMAAMGSEAQDLGLTLDVGHLVVTGDRPEGDVIRALADDLVHVHLDDCPVGSHQHLPFGEGDLDLSGVLSALLEVSFKGVAAVELSRDSHRGPEAAAQALSVLRRALSRSA